jgi:hypothetical protein
MGAATTLLGMMPPGLHLFQPSDISLSACQPPVLTVPPCPALPAAAVLQRDLQTKRQIEKAVDILRKNGVNSDYVYVSAAVVGSGSSLSQHGLHCTLCK